MPRISLFNVAIDYERPKSDIERVISALSNYFYLGGTRVTVVDGNEIRLNQEKIRWYSVAWRVVSYFLFYHVTLPLFAVYPRFQYWNRFTIQNATIQGASAYVVNSSFLSEQILGSLGFQNDYPVMIYLFRQDLQNRPLHHLKQLSQAIQINSQIFEDPRIMVYYTKGELSSDFIQENLVGEAADTGGVSRDYIHELSRALVSKLSAGSAASYLPVEGSPHLENVFENLGTLLMYCYNSKEQVKAFGGTLFISRLTGRYFDEALFSSALCLAAEEIDAPQLRFETKIRMCQALVQSRIDAGEELGWLMARLHQITEAFPENDQEWMESLGVNNEDLPPNLDKSKREEFIEKVVWLCVQNATQVDIEKMFKPILAIARGMKKICLTGGEFPVEEKNSYWNDITCKIPYQTFSDKVQGCSLTPAVRKSIAERIIYDGDNAKIRRDVERLQEWIVHRDTSVKEVRIFLKFATGSSTLLDGQIITVSSQNVYPSVVPKASTCTFTLTFSTHYPDDLVEKQRSQSEEEKTRTFITYLKQEMRRMMDAFDSN